MPSRSQVLFRLLAVCLVGGTIMKLVLQPSSKNGNQEHNTIKKGAKFWKSNLGDKDSSKVSWQQENRLAPETVNPEQDDGKAKHEVAVQQDVSRGPMRVVHLDLKGASPKVSYLEQIFPLLSALGADGVLLEYEDMFPYEGDLQILRSPHAYSIKDIEKIRTLARLSKLEVIPLVQVFGHLEFVLKHEKYHVLREVESFPNSLNPHLPGAHALVTDMVMQVLSQHPDACWFHIGADEVFGLGESQDSKNWLHTNQGNVGKMFLNHVTAVGRSVIAKYPGIKLLMWDDMMRVIDSADLRGSILPSIASPVIWRYNPNFSTEHVENLISKYQDAGFKSVWFASAFKGASGIDQRWTPMEHHLKNHLTWLKVMESMIKYPSISFQGILLTGWQRYEHFTVLCELLPVGIPSLAVCLQTLKYGGFTDTTLKAVHHILGCKIEMEKDICEGSGAFSGAELYHMIHHIHTNLQSDAQSMMNDHNIKGAFSLYHRKYNFANPRNLGFFRKKLEEMLDTWETFLENFRSQMEAIYFPDTVEEWMEQNVNNHMDQIRHLSQDVARIMALNGRPKSLSKL